MAKPQSSRNSEVAAVLALVQQFMHGNISLTIYAGVAQLIERFLAKEEAQGLSPCTRTIQSVHRKVGFLYGAVNLAQTLTFRHEKGFDSRESAQKNTFFEHF